MAAAPNRVFKLSGRRPEKAPLGSVVILYCYLSPKVSAVPMEIRWFKETDCVCLYKNGQLTVGRGYECRVSLFTHEMERGNVSLLLRECRECDIGHYLCQVTNGDTTEELTARVWWRPLKSFFRFFKGGVIPHVNIEQWCRKWTEEERLKMEDSALLSECKTDVKSMKMDLQEKQSLLELTEEQLRNAKLESERAEEALQSKSSQLQMMVVVLEQLKTELAEKAKRLEEKERLLSERDTQLMERDKQVEERNKQLQERTDPDLSVTVSKELELPPNLGESSTLASPESVPASELRLVLLGRTGCGKRAAGNTIQGREERSQAGTSTVRQQSESRQGEVAGRQVTVVETPDWFSPGLSLEELRQDVGLCVHLSAPGPHVFLLVIPVKQSTGEERGMLEKMEEIFGERCWRNTMILFTVTDEVQEKNIEEFIQSGNQEVQRLVEKCGNRFHCLSIKESGDGSQVSELLEKIEKMVAGNEESFYSSEIYLETESQITKQEEEKEKAREEEEEEEEEEVKEILEKVVQDSLRKIELVIQEREEDIRELNKQTAELERKIKEEKDVKQKTKLERQLKQDLQKRIKMENIIHSLKEMREREEREMEDRHGQEMEAIRETYEGEAKMEVERNLMKLILPELKGSILASNSKMQEEFSRQMEEKDRELEKLKQRLSELEEAQHLEKKLKESIQSPEARSSGCSKKRTDVKKLLLSE